MHSFNRDVGSLGESLAVKYLTDMGYIILDRNFRCKLGEIDIIAKDNDYISFIEVKSRYGLCYGTPAESVTLHKQYRIYRAAQLYILKKNIHKYDFRFDVLELIFNNNDNNYSIRLIKDAFQL